MADATWFQEFQKNLGSLEERTAAQLRLEGQQLREEFKLDQERFFTGIKNAFDELIAKMERNARAGTKLQEISEILKGRISPNRKQLDSKVGYNLQREDQRFELWRGREVVTSKMFINGWNVKQRLDEPVGDGSPESSYSKHINFQKRSTGTVWKELTTTSTSFVEAQNHLKWRQQEKKTTRCSTKCQEEGEPQQVGKNLKQTGTLEEYQDQFNALLNKVRPLPQDFLMDQFLKGLEEELQELVRGLRPATLREAQLFAKLQDIAMTARRRERGKPLLPKPLISKPLAPNSLEEPFNLGNTVTKNTKRLTEKELNENRIEAICEESDEEDEEEIESETIGGEIKKEITKTTDFCLKNKDDTRRIDSHSSVGLFFPWGSEASSDFDATGGSGHLLNEQEPLVPNCTSGTSSTEKIRYNVSSFVKDLGLFGPSKLQSKRQDKQLLNEVVEAGEYMISKVIELSQQRRKTTCTQNVNGVICKGALHQPPIYDGTVTHNGAFKALPLLDLYLLIETYGDYNSKCESKVVVVDSNDGIWSWNKEVNMIMLEVEMHGGMPQNKISVNGMTIQFLSWLQLGVNLLNWGMIITSVKEVCVDSAREFEYPRCKYSMIFPSGQG